MTRVWMSCNNNNSSSNIETCGVGCWNNNMSLVGRLRQLRCVSACMQLRPDCSLLEGGMHAPHADVGRRVEVITSWKDVTKGNPP